MKKPPYLALKLGALAGMAAVAGIWILLDLGCPIRNVTGVICPGCGMSRAWFAALGLDLPQAFRYHPMFWSVPVVVGMGLYDFRPLKPRWLNYLILFALFLGLTVCYVMRLTAFLRGNLVI